MVWAPFFTFLFKKLTQNCAQAILNILLVNRGVQSVRHRSTLQLPDASLARFAQVQERAKPWHDVA